ncbi:MAG: acetolactate synthase small subunit [Clostridia bacterium]|nr:acetolactate synthase small subunit [Clostridia bacterium]MBQ6093387.1 acetolactate synthase small subunit [Clostridia bacterium]
MRSVIAVYVENKYGVLTRVAGLFMRKGFNIDSLTVGETEDPAYSRMTITLNGNDYAREQLINQLKKLHNVKEVKLLESAQNVERELLLLKVPNHPETRSEIMAAADVYRGKIIDYSTDAMIIEVTGEPLKIQAFIDVVKPIGIIEMCRTGVVSLERGATVLHPEES